MLKPHEREHEAGNTNHDHMKGAHPKPVGSGWFAVTVGVL
jgi:hypothetical protein